MKIAMTHSEIADAIRISALEYWQFGYSHYHDEPEMMEMYDGDLAHLTSVANMIQHDDIALAQQSIGRMETECREQLSTDIFNYIMEYEA